MKTLKQILGDEFDRRYSDHIHPTVMKAVKTYLYKQIKEMVREIERLKGKLDHIEAMVASPDTTDKKKLEVIEYILFKELKAIIGEERPYRLDFDKQSKNRKEGG